MVIVYVCACACASAPRIILISHFTVEQKRAPRRHANCQRHGELETYIKGKLLVGVMRFLHAVKNHTKNNVPSTVVKQWVVVVTSK